MFYPSSFVALSQPVVNAHIISASPLTARRLIEQMVNSALIEPSRLIAAPLFSLALAFHLAFTRRHGITSLLAPATITFIYFALAPTLTLVRLHPLYLIASCLVQDIIETMMLLIIESTSAPLIRLVTAGQMSSITLRISRSPIIRRASATLLRRTSVEFALTTFRQILKAREAAFEAALRMLAEEMRRAFARTACGCVIPDDVAHDGRATLGLGEHGLAVSMYVSTESAPDYAPVGIEDRRFGVPLHINIERGLGHPMRRPPPRPPHITNAAHPTRIPLEIRKHVEDAFDRRFNFDETLEPLHKTSGRMSGNGCRMPVKG